MNYFLEMKYVLSKPTNQSRELRCVRKYAQNHIQSGKAPFKVLITCYIFLTKKDNASKLIKKLSCARKTVRA